MGYDKTRQTKYIFDIRLLFKPFHETLNVVTQFKYKGGVLGVALCCKVPRETNAWHTD